MSFPPPTNQEDIPGRWMYLKGTSCPYCASTPQVTVATWVSSNKCQQQRRGWALGWPKHQNQFGTDLWEGDLCQFHLHMFLTAPLCLPDGILLLGWQQVPQGRGRKEQILHKNSTNHVYLRTIEQARRAPDIFPSTTISAPVKFSKSTFFKDSSAITKQEAPQEAQPTQGNSEYFTMHYNNQMTTHYTQVTPKVISPIYFHGNYNKEHSNIVW